MTTFDNQNFIFESWLPQYSQIVEAVEQDQVMKLWVYGKQVYQVEVPNGLNISF